MYDTLTFFAPVDDPARLVGSLDNVQERHDHVTGEVTVTGRLRDLYVKTSGSGVTVNGSLSRYWCESNLIAPSFSNCREAMEQLAEELGASLASMNVYRIDVAATLNVKHPCTRYLRMFGRLPRFKRFERDGGLLYKTNRRELDFYDKRAEAKSRKEVLPESFNGNDALRYELRYRQQLKEQFAEQVTAERLIDPDFFRELVRRWESSYHAIHKQAGALALGLNTTNPKSFGASLECLAIERLGGEGAVLDELELRRACGEIDRLTYSRLRTRVVQRCRMKKQGEGEGSIAELDEAIALEAKRLVSFE